MATRTLEAQILRLDTWRGTIPRRTGRMNIGTISVYFDTDWRSHESATKGRTGRVTVCSPPRMDARLDAEACACTKPPALPASGHSPGA